MLGVLGVELTGVVSGKKSLGSGDNHNDSQGTVVAATLMNKAMTRLKCWVDKLMARSREKQHGRGS